MSEHLEPIDRLCDAILAVRDELAGLRVALETFVVPEGQPTHVCEHPEDQRIDFGMTDGKPDWRCKVCDHHSLAETA